MVCYGPCPAHQPSQLFCPFPRASMEQSRPQYFAWHGCALDKRMCYFCLLILALYG